jgi:ankyrin repeat protein
MSAIHESARRGDLDTLQRLLESGVALDERDEGGMTPLHYAAFAGQCETATFILNRGLPTDIRDGEGSTPLYFASYSGKTAMVRLLLDRGADVNGSNCGFYTPLLIACENGHTEIANILLDHGAQVNHASRGGVTPLKAALSGRHDAIVSLLRKHVASTERSMEASHEAVAPDSSREKRVEAFVQQLLNCQDPAAAELTKIQFRWQSDGAGLTELVELVGAAVNNPDFFVRQPLTRCAPGMAVKIPDKAIESGTRFLREELPAIRSAIKDAGIQDPWNQPERSCTLVISSTHGFPKSEDFLESEDYRRAVGFLVLVVLQELTKHIGQSFCTASDKELVQSFLKVLEGKQREKMQQAAESILRRFGHV